MSRSFARSSKTTLTILASWCLAGCAGAPPAEPVTPAGEQAANVRQTPETPLGIQSFAASEKAFYVTSSLIVGDKEAVLIDAQFLKSDAERLVGVVKDSGKTLTTIYVTHAHPDHYFGLPVLQAAFPEAKVLAHPLVAREMAERFQAKHAQWKPMFGAELADTRVDATPYDAPTLTLEGRTIELLGPVAGDDAHTVLVVVPSARAVIAGDVSYAGIYPWTADSTPAGWKAWRETLARAVALEPRVVVSGHRAPGRADSPADLQATSQYISDFEAAVQASKTPEEVIKLVSAKYPALELPIVLQLGAKAAFGGGH